MASLIFQFPDREKEMIIDRENNISGFDADLIGWTSGSQRRQQWNGAKIAILMKFGIPA